MKSIRSEIPGECKMASPRVILFLSVCVAVPAFAAQTKYKTSFQHAGSAAVEGEVSYEPFEGGKRVKSRAIVSFVGRPTEVVKILEQSWLSESDLAVATLESCVASGGVLENVTVKAGTFAACKIHTMTPEIEITKWTGNVPPSGLLRMDLKKKEVQTREELVDYAPE